VVGIKGGQERVTVPNL